MEGPLGHRLPHFDGDTPPSADDILSAFLAYTKAEGLTLYPAQEEAILELYSGANVILNTPTGSGKSLVALAWLFWALATEKRAYYTFPIKALASEKFFQLARALSPEWIGMATGDGSVNRDAWVTCATAEILASLALSEGRRAKVDCVVMDEFHYYADVERGVAWQIPLLALPQSQFLLMSATLGPTETFVESLTKLTGRRTVLVKSTERPVPLDFNYLETHLQETIRALLDRDKAPIYLVSSSQREASEAAQNLMSIDVCSKDEKRQIADRLQGFSFDTPYGKILSRFVRHGIGVHHAGLLPKYRMLVERLAGEGLLKVVSGTDTLGVGVNIPIRSVLFTKLCKYDGTRTRIFSAREFHQMSGRAGRRGYDTAGSVYALAPEHVVENLRLEAKAGNDPAKRRKIVKKKPPERGYVPWDKSTLDKLVVAEPEPLLSRFQVSQGMVLDMLLREEEGGCLGLGRMIRDSHESDTQKRVHGRTARAIATSLIAQDVVVVRPGQSPRFALRDGLQRDFAMNQSLSLFLHDAVLALDRDAPTYAWDLLSVVESVIEDPGVVLERMLDSKKRAALSEMKQSGMSFEERMEALEKIELDKPMASFLYETFDVFRAAHPWLAHENVRPKPVLRSMLEGGLTFIDFIKEHELPRSEGVLLRYLSDAFRTLEQGVPEEAKTNEVMDVADSISAMIRSTDSSLIEEWERLRSGVTAPLVPEKVKALPDAKMSDREFRVLVQNALFALGRHVARRDFQAMADLLSEPTDAGQLERMLSPVYKAHHEYVFDGRARLKERYQLEVFPEGLRGHYTLVDRPERSAEAEAAARVLDREAGTDAEDDLGVGGPAYDTAISVTAYRDEVRGLRLCLTGVLSPDLGAAP
jgi:superfamily II RNA helicase